MSVFGNSEVAHFRRLGVNLIKVGYVVIALFAFHFFSARTQDPESLLHFTIASVFGISSLSALTVVCLESFDVPRTLIMILGVLSLLAVGFDLLNGHSAHWVCDANPFMLTMFFLIFIFVQIILSANDTEMDSFTSEYCYPAQEHRSARFLVHFVWNTFPYVIGTTLQWFILMTSGARGVAEVFFIETVLLLSFCMLDEYIRFRRHWSFFWYNRPVCRS